MKTVLCLAALIALGSASYCPTYSCDASLTSNVCASYVSGSAFKLNSNGCQTDYYCSAIAVGLWAELINSSEPTPSGSTTSCIADTTSDTTTTSFTSMSCGTKLANKNFKSGQTVISCTADTDCKLADDTYTNCMCVFKTDGTGICEASTSNDQVYGGYWTDCGSSNTITDVDIAAYWVLYMLYWEYTQSTVSCMNIFLETTTLSDFYDFYNGVNHCAEGCDYCVGKDPMECFDTQEQVDFVKYADTSFNLPLTTETDDHLLCFNQHRTSTACTPDPLLASVTGEISNYESGSGAAPTKFQCYELLTVQWVWLLDWFDTLFPGFQGPADATDSEKQDIKSIIYLWILNLGPAVMSRSNWSELRAVLTDSASDWSLFLGWVGTTPGYITDGTATMKNYPTALLDWLNAGGCEGTTAGCPDLAVFNLKSTVCGSACAVQSFCSEVDSTSYCAKNGSS